MSVSFVLFFIIPSVLSFSSFIETRAFISSSYLDMSSVSTISAAEAISKATTSYDILKASEFLISPGKETKHYEFQEHHQKKRQIAGTNALKRLVKYLIGESASFERNKLISNPLFGRLCCCAFAPTSTSTNSSCSETYSEPLIETYLEALRALGSLSPVPKSIIDDILIPFLKRIQPEIKANKNVPHALISSAEWACRRLGIDQTYYSEITALHKDLQLPFYVVPGFASDIVTIQDIRKEVPFQSEDLITRTGKRVQERRETCWMAEPGVGGLAYSGKIMSPVPFSPTVTRVRDAIEEATGIRYDCCLINWYGDGESACKFHVDPDMGRLWARDTVVVSIGETRRFNLRSIALATGSGSASASGVNAKTLADNDESLHHTFHLFHGDCFYMFGDCQETFQHCVMKGEGSNNNNARASIVFKKSLPGAGGRRGHGIKRTTDSHSGVNAKLTKESPKALVKGSGKPLSMNPKNKKK